MKGILFLFMKSLEFYKHQLFRSFFLTYYFSGIPLVNVPQPSYSVNYDGSVTLTCTVTANPTHTTVYWQRIVNGVSTTVTLGNRYSGSTVNTPSLTITNADQSDEGFYVCYATNSVGTGNSQQTYLDVAGSKLYFHLKQILYTVKPL